MRALIVDDNELVRLVTGQMVDHFGFTVVGYATSGEEAVEIAGACEPDVIVMDYDLPGLNGIEATRAIRAKYPVPVVLCTGHGGVDLLDLAREAGISSVLFKPFASHVLEHALRAACSDQAKADEGRDADDSSQTGGE